MNTDPREETVHYAGKGGMYADQAVDHQERLLERMAAHAEHLVHLSHRISNVLDRIHGPQPEQMNKTADSVEPRSTMMWQIDKMESQARRLSNLIEGVENAI